MTFGSGKPLLGDGAFYQRVHISSSAICCKDFFVPLNRIDDVREMTFSVLIFARSVVNASVIPSAKYSWSGSQERFSSGSTAMD